MVTSYLAAATVVMPVYGKLGDRFGRRPMLLVAVALFVTGAVLCAAAGSIAAADRLPRSSGRSAAAG